jgi:hypothetical protein
LSYGRTTGRRLYTVFHLCGLPHWSTGLFSGSSVNPGLALVDALAELFGVVERGERFGVGAVVFEDPLRERFVLVDGVRVWNREDRRKLAGGAFFF